MLDRAGCHSHTVFRYRGICGIGEERPVKMNRSQFSGFESADFYGQPYVGRRCYMSYCHQIIPLLFIIYNYMTINHLINIRQP